MKILKASFFNNETHKIQEVICAKATEKYVFFHREGRESQLNNSAYRVEKRKSHDYVYCETEIEAKQFIYDRYSNAIKFFEKKIIEHELLRSKIFLNKKQGK